MTSIFQGLVEKAQGLVHFDVGVGDVSSSYALFPVGGADTFSTPDSVNNSIRQHITGEFDIAPDDWTPAVAYAIASKWNNTGDQRGFIFYIGSDGTISLFVTEDGLTNSSAKSTASTGFVDGSRHTVKYTWDAITRETTFYADGVQLGNVVLSLDVLSIHDSIANLIIGALTAGANDFFGKIYSTKIYKGIPGETFNPYGLFDGVVGSYIGTFDTVENSIRQSFRIEMEFQFTDYTSTTQAIAAKHGSGGNSWLFEVGSTGNIFLQVVSTVDGNFQISTGAQGWADNEIVKLRFDFDLITGFATLSRLVNGTYVNLLAPQAITTGDVADSTTAINIGARSNGGLDMARGKIYSTQMWKGIPGVTFEPYIYLDGAAGTYVSTPDTPANSVTGSITLEGDIALDDWVPAGGGVIIAKQIATGSQRSYSLSVNTSGRISVSFNETGATAETSTSNVLGFAAGSRHTIKAEWDIPSNLVTFYADGVIIGVPQVTTFTSIFDSTSEVSLGAINEGTSLLLKGTVYDAKVYKGVGPDKTLVVDMVVPYSYKQGDPTFDSSLETWTLEGNAIANSPADDGLRVDMNPYPALQDAAVFPLNAVDVPVAQLTGIAGAYFSEPDSLVNSITGDIDIRWLGSLDDWTPAGSSTLLSKYGSAGSRSWFLNVQGSGILRFSASADGTATITADTVKMLGYADGSVHGIRAALSIANQEVEFFTSVDGINWTSFETVAAVIAGIFDSFTAVEVGSRESGTAAVMAGTCESAQVYDGIDGTLAVNFDPASLQGWTINGGATVSNVWVIHGEALANSPIDDGLKSCFNPASFPNSSVANEIWTANGLVSILVSAMMRNLYWNPLSDFEAAVYASVGEPAVAFGAGGLSFDAGSRLRIAYGGGGDKVNLPGGMAATPDGSLIVGGPPDVIHQGVGLTNECYVSDVALAGLLSESIAWFDETSIVGLNTVTDWNNKGAGGSGYNFDTVVGTATDLTRMRNGSARNPGEVGDFFSTPDSDLNSITGVIDIRWFGAMDAWAPGSEVSLVCKWDGPSLKQITLGLAGNGALRTYISHDGSTQPSFTTSIPFFSAEFNTVHGIRVTYSPATGDLDFYYSDDGVDWTFFETKVAATGLMFDSSSSWQIGGISQAINLVPACYTYWAKVYAGIYNGGPFNAEGPELVKNPGNPFISTDDWTPVGVTLVTVDAGSLWVDRNGGGDSGSGHATSPVNFIAGHRYRITIDVAARVNGWDLMVNGDVNVPVFGTQTTTGIFTIDYVAQAGADSVGIRCLNASTANVRVASISVKELTPQLAVNFDPSDATEPQTAWVDPDTAATWTPQQDVFVNTTGKDVLNDAGAAYMETASGPNILTPYTFFLAGKVTVITAIAQDFIGARAQATEALILRIKSLAGGGDFLANAGISVTQVSGDTLPHVHTIQQNADVTSVYEVSDIGKITADIGTQIFDFAALFASGTGAQIMNGWVGEVVVFDRALTAEELSIMQDYLANKWT